MGEEAWGAQVGAGDDVQVMLAMAPKYGTDNTEALRDFLASTRLAASIHVHGNPQICAVRLCEEQTWAVFLEHSGRGAVTAVDEGLTTGQEGRRG